LRTQKRLHMQLRTFKIGPHSFCNSKSDLDSDLRGPKIIVFFQIRFLSNVNLNQAKVAVGWKSNFKGPKSQFRNLFLCPKYRNQLRKCGYEMEKYFFRKLRTSEKIAIAPRDAEMKLRSNIFFKLRIWMCESLSFKFGNCDCRHKNVLFAHLWKYVFTE
jgi:hypothetical protein